MTSKLKFKISIGVVFLFALLLFEGGAGLYYLNKTIAEQRNILKENYESIEYARNMLSALDSISDIKTFEYNLAKQELHNGFYRTHSSNSKIEHYITQSLKIAAYGI